MKKTDIKCRLMSGCGGNEKTGTIFCDSIAWEIRKMYPKNYECCSKDGRCLGRDEGKDLRNPESECGFREECACGETCCGLGNNYCVFASEILKEKEINRLKKAYQTTASPRKRDEILYQLTLAGQNPQKMMA